MKQKSIIFLIVFLLFLPFFVHAAGLVPCGGPTEKPCTVIDAFYGVARVTNWLILSSSLYLFYIIVNQGFWLVSSAGNEENITKHRKAIMDGIAGFFVVLAAYMFMNTAVNIILMSKCKIDFANPLDYVLSMKDTSKCVANPAATDALKASGN